MGIREEVGEFKGELKELENLMGIFEMLNNIQPDGNTISVNEKGYVVALERSSVLINLLIPKVNEPIENYIEEVNEYIELQKIIKKNKSKFTSL